MLEHSTSLYQLHDANGPGKLISLAHRTVHPKDLPISKNWRGCVSEGIAGPERSSVKATRGDRPITEITVHSKTQITNSLSNALKRSTVAGGSLHLLLATKRRPGCWKPLAKRDGAKIGRHSHLYFVYRRGIYTVPMRSQKDDRNVVSVGYVRYM